MKQKQIIASCVVSALMLTTLSTTALASSKINNNEPYSNTSNLSTSISEQQNLSQNEINSFDKYVYFNPQAKKFEIKDEATISLNKNDYKKLSTNIENTNEILKTVDFNSKDKITITDSQNSYTYGDNNNDNKKVRQARAAYKNGVSKIDFYWSGMNIYLSKSAIATIGAGMTISGIWIPEPLVSKAVATLGVGIGFVKGGIKIEYSYLKAGIKKITHRAPLMVGGIHKVSYQ